MQLKISALLILDQIRHLVEQLRPTEYSASLELLSGNTIGKHIRHVLEFFDLLVNSQDSDTLNYDNREHNELIESDKEVCLNTLKNIIHKLNQVDGDSPLILQVSYSEEKQKPVNVQTSLNRELAYNIEHAIHHMAIMKIAVITVFPHVNLPENFGVAYSTIRYQNIKN